MYIKPWLHAVFDHLSTLPTTFILTYNQWRLLFIGFILWYWKVCNYFLPSLKPRKVWNLAAYIYICIFIHEITQEYVLKLWFLYWIHFAFEHISKSGKRYGKSVVKGCEKVWNWILSKEEEPCFQVHHMLKKVKMPHSIYIFIYKIIFCAKMTGAC